MTNHIYTTIRKRRLLFVAIALLLSAPAVNEAVSQELTQERGFVRKADTTDGFVGYTDKYALLVGINDYLDPNVRDLKYAVDDVESIRQVLIRDYGFAEGNIVSLVNSAASKDAIIRSLSRYISDDISQDSQLLVYFAGHGATLHGEDGQYGMLLPYDASIENRSTTFSSGIAMNELRNVAGQLRPKHALFLMDACYGGLAQTRDVAPTPFVRNALLRNARQIITAGTADEEVLESSAWGHSSFTKALLDALGGKKYGDADDDGIITADELANYLKNRVSYFAETQGGRQSPQFSKLIPGDGTFLFMKDNSAVQSMAPIDVLSGPTEEQIIESFKTPVTITSNIENARVFLDDEEVGFLSRYRLRYPISPGYYTLKLSRERYRDAVMEIEVLPDTTMTVAVRMEKLYGVVSFTVDPPDAGIYVDGDLVGIGRVEKELSKGGHNLSIKRDGYRPLAETISVVQDSLTIRKTLDRIEQIVELYTVPLGAAVSLNEDSLGVSPVTLTLGYGSHAILLTLEGYRSELVILNVTESGLDRKVFSLRETPEVIAHRAYRAQLRKHAVGASLSTSLAIGAYIGHKVLNNQYEKANDNDENKATYNYARWAALGATGALAINAMVRAVGFLTTDYDSFLQQQLQAEMTGEVAAAFIVDPLNTTVGVRINF